MGPPRAPLRKEGDISERFIDYFYKQCISTLVKPLLELSEWRNVNGEGIYALKWTVLMFFFPDPVLPLFREEASRFTLLCDILHQCISQHNFHSHFFVISFNILSRVASLLKAKDKHLRHGTLLVAAHQYSYSRSSTAAFRIFRLLLKQNNPTSLNHMCKLDVLKPILDLTLRESRRDNLLSCSCHEFFDLMRRVGCIFLSIRRPVLIQAFRKT